MKTLLTGELWVSILCTILLIVFLSIAGCTASQGDPGLVWAVNVGGPAYTGVDGVAYAAEEYVSGGIDDSIFPQRQLVDYVRAYEST